MIKCLEGWFRRGFRKKSVPTSIYTLANFFKQNITRNEQAFLIGSDLVETGSWMKKKFHGFRVWNLIKIGMELAIFATVVVYRSALSSGMGLL